MPRISSKSIEHVIGITLSEEMEQKIKFVYSLESQAMRDEVAKLAKAEGITETEYFANLIFSREFDRKLEYAQTKIEAKAEEIYNLYLSTGMDEKQAREYANMIKVG